ncbi:MAG: PAS domain S-box protein [Magnetococcus sp. YQC-5]
MLTSHHSTSPPHWPARQKTSSLWILFSTCLVLSTLGLHWYIGSKLSKVTVPLAHASVDIKFQITSFHLALEERIHGNNMPEKQVWKFLEEALWHVQAMLNGGTNDDGTYYPLTAPSARLLLETTTDHLKRLKILAKYRLENHQTIGSQSDDEFNHLFWHILEASNQVHKVIKQEIDQLEQQYQLVGLSLGGLLIVLALLAWLVIHAHELRRRTSEQHNAYLARIIDQSANEIYLFNMDSFHFTMANDSTLRNLQYQTDELMEMTPLQIMPAFSLEPFKHLLKPLLDRTQTSLQFETIHRRKDGSIYDVNVNLQQIQYQDTPLLVAFVQDITQQKQTQQNLLLQDTALKAAANTIVITDIHGNIQWVNPAFTKTTGYTLEEAIGQNPRILKSNEQDVGFYQNLWTTILSGQVWQGVFINKCKDGRLVHEEATITPVLNTMGQVVQFIAVKQDVTKRIQAELELQEAKRKAEAASQAKSDFLATMSHEIRTPLNVVLGILELLKESNLEPSSQEQIQLAQGAGKMLLYLINDILDYSKIEANQLVLDTIPFNLRTLLDDIAMGMAPLAHTKHVELTVFFPRECPVLVRGDPNRLRQIFTNLISNAIKFTPEGGVVEFHGGPVHRDGDVIEYLFEIRDTGIGIPIRNREQIFERFVQANTSTTRQYGGTGLGLAICQRLVHMMNGTIEVDSNPFAQSGSIFHFTVQLLEQIHQPVDLIQEVPSDLRVLIVGCHGLQLALLRNALQAWKAQFEEISELQTTLATINQATHKPYQVVIINQWPGQNRPPEWHELRGTYSDARFLLLMDRLDQAMEQAMELPGDTLCLKKPFSLQQLYTTIIKLLQIQTHSPQKWTHDSLPQPQPTSYSASILLVDDQTANLMVTLGMLSKIGCDRHRCVTATDGQQAVDQFKKTPFDLIFMDCQMPVMDGYHATRAIREWEQLNGRHPVPIIALTADVTLANQQKGKESGMNDFLDKPVSMNDLRRMLDRYCPICTPSPSTSQPAHSTNINTIIAALQAIGLEENDWTNIARLITTQFPELMNTMERHLLNAHLDQARATAHVIQGSMINIIFPEMQQLTKALHDSVRKQLWHEALQHLTQTRILFAPIHAILTTWLNQLQSN